MIDMPFVLTRNRQMKHETPLRQLKADLDSLRRSSAFWQKQPRISVLGYGQEVRSGQLGALEALILQTEQAIRILEADDV
jgi:hypothetical protein